MKELVNEGVWYVVSNSVPEKRDGDYLLIRKGAESVIAFGLSLSDAIRAQKSGAAYLGETDAAGLIACISD